MARYNLKEEMVKTGLELYELNTQDVLEMLKPETSIIHAEQILIKARNRDKDQRPSSIEVKKARNEFEKQMKQKKKIS